MNTSLRLALLALASLTLPDSLQAAIDYGLNGEIWRMRYGVTPAQLGNPTWLAADDDKDGLSNGSELAAGTDPFAAGSTIRISAVVPNGLNIDLSFPTVPGKQYVAQRSANLTSPAWTATGTPLTGDGSTRTIPVAKSAGNFYRVLVQDLDTDNDQVSDWAERVAGYDPTTANTRGSTTDDHTSLVAGVAGSNVVTVAATEVTATQPPDAATAPADTGRIVVRRSGPLLFNSITVPLQKTGTATEGTDYDALPATVTFPVDAAEVFLDVNPKANLSRKTNVTAIVKAIAGLGYSLGGTASGSVVIFPAGRTNGTGLTASYHNTSDSDYTTQTAIFNGTAELSRNDGPVNFSSGANGWGSTGGPTGLSPASTNRAFSVRWTGQILPQYSETYTIDFRSDDSAKVWVNGRLLIDRWTTLAATDYINTIDLEAGVLYDIQIDYWNAAASTTAEAKLYWWSASQVKEIIPRNRLFPAPSLASKFNAITSAIDVIGYEGTPLNFSITTPDIGGTVTYALNVNSAALPPGLTLNGTTGIISGTPTLAGSYNCAINATNTAASAVRGSSVVQFTIYPVGGFSREVLTATGSTVASIVLPNGDPGHTTIATADDDGNHPNNTGKRLRGYFVPPKTGNYYFWIAANNAAELYISNSAEAVSKVRRAVVTPAGTGKKVWNAQPGQISDWLTFVAGEKYYFEVLHNTGADADDHVSVGWCQDDNGAAIAVSGSANPTGTPAQIPNGGAALRGFPLSGTMPGYVFQPYDYPITVAATGSLYVCNLGPQGGAATTAGGSASLRLNAAGTQAILKFEYRGLVSPRTAYHLHVDGFDSHPQGEIIFDIDDIDAFHPELHPSAGEYIWNIVPGGTFPTAALIVDAIQRGKVYLNIHSVLYPAGEIRGTFGLIDGSQTPPATAAYVDPGYPDDHATDAGAARFLNQATFGASPGDIAYVKANGFAAWIANQLAKPASTTSGDVAALATTDVTELNPPENFVNTWWKYAITGEDQLRQRLAFALSQITVISYLNNQGPLAENAKALADYYDTLIEHCLPTPGLDGSGTYSGLLQAVTLTPAMGVFLDMRANQLADLSIGRHPNENYAREILQLFSVGLYGRWDDGRLKLDSKANLVPTYRQPEVIGFANTFTGWNYAQALQSNGRLPTSFSPSANYQNPMVLVPARHERGSKLLLDRVVLPPATGQTPRVNITGVTVASPADIQTSTQHGLKVGDTVRIANLSGGTFNSPNSINSYHLVAEVTGPTAFRVGINCTVAPTANDGYVYGATVIAADGLGSGGFTTSGLITVNDSQSDSTGATTSNTGSIVGATTLVVSATGILGKTYSQAAGSNVLTVNTISPQTNIDVRGDATISNFTAPATVGNPTILTAAGHGLTTGAVVEVRSINTGTFSPSINAHYTVTVIDANSFSVPVNCTVANTNLGNFKRCAKSRVHLSFLSGSPRPADGVYDVQTAGSNSFTVFTADTPVSARNGKLLLPKMDGSYKALSSTTVLLRTKVNHNLQIGDHVWVGTGVATGGPYDGEFQVTDVTDNQTVTVSYPMIYPAPIGNYPGASGGRNGITFWPLRPAPTGRSGVVSIGTSTFRCNGTDAALGQTPLNAPSVFNFFYPDYKYPGSLANNNLDSPEFQLSNDSAIAVLTNSLTKMFIGTGGSNDNLNGLSSFDNGGGSIVFDLGEFMTPAQTSNAGIFALIDKISDRLVGGPLTPGVRTAIRTTVANNTNFPYSTPTNQQMRDRVRAIIHQILITGEYAIQR